MDDACRVVKLIDEKGFTLERSQFINKAQQLVEVLSGPSISPQLPIASRLAIAQAFYEANQYESVVNFVRRSLPKKNRPEELNIVLPFFQLLLLGITSGLLRLIDDVSPTAEAEVNHPGIYLLHTLTQLCTVRRPLMCRLDLAFL